MRKQTQLCVMQDLPFQKGKDFNMGRQKVQMLPAKTSVGLKDVGRDVSSLREGEAEEKAGGGRRAEVASIRLPGALHGREVNMWALGGTVGSLWRYSWEFSHEPSSHWDLFRGFNL